MLEKILAELKPSGTKLVAVSKTKSPDKIQGIYDRGHKVFGENRVQELLPKYEILPKDIEWHLIGHLQRNKVKYIAPFVSLIHSVDNLKLLKEINKQAEKYDRKINCLLQFHIATEETKFGLDLEEAENILSSDSFQILDNVSIAGVMGMASFVTNEAQIRTEFRHLKAIFEKLKSTYFKDNSAFKEISMGMSGDYKIAIEEGSTMVRIGTLIFGPR